ncbi:hypothetical protein [Ramlibacter pallidus]|uniref:DUF1963 domain-containing protein n=1 Tax=Ramlibacter pallidus TaxID=2780087 RepID=A0ABR9S3F0_9BURK|nr:hypothetical protein [Ramlibacter pallidus]MBE7368011.1 hypothetical protein [Ramlibacter pallidus]
MRRIPPIPLVTSPETPEAERAIGFQWAGDPVGKRHRIGGDPDGMQQGDVPVCSCGKHMSFYGQLDSIGDEYCIADCALIYVFLCWDCFETKSVLQSA